MMQGFQITAYVNAEWPNDARRPVREDRIVKSWRSTYAKAEREADRLAAEHGAITVIE